MNVRLRHRAGCSSCSEYGSHWSTRYWSGIVSWKFGKHGAEIACSDGMSDAYPSCTGVTGSADRLPAPWCPSSSHCDSRVPGVPVDGISGKRQVVRVVDVLAEVLDAHAGLLGGVPEEAVTLVGERVAALRRIGAVEGAELLLDVVVGLGLNDPVVPVGRERALVVEVVEVAEPLGQGMRVGRDVRPNCASAGSPLPSVSSGGRRGPGRRSGSP